MQTSTNEMNNISLGIWLSSVPRIFRGRKTSKLMPKYIGPYKISGRVGSVAYKLQKPDKY
jgi:hypothetical protein